MCVRHASPLSVSNTCASERDARRSVSQYCLHDWHPCKQVASHSTIESMAAMPRGMCTCCLYPHSVLSMRVLPRHAGNRHLRHPMSRRWSRTCSACSQAAWRQTAAQPSGSCSRQINRWHPHVHVRAVALYARYAPPASAGARAVGANGLRAHAALLACAARRPYGCSCLIHAAAHRPSENGEGGQAAVAAGAAKASPVKEKAAGAGLGPGVGVLESCGKSGLVRCILLDVDAIEQHRLVLRCGEKWRL